MTTAHAVEMLRGEVGQIVAKHAAAKGRRDFTKYADDPAGFIRDVLHAEPWSAQVEMAELVRDHPRVCLVSANAIGKDWLVARLALWWVYARRGFVILTSVTDRQARNISMKEVRKAFLRTPSLPGELFQMELRVDDASGILAFTSDSIEKLVGFHHPWLLLALSEGQGLEPGVFEAAFACATGPENRVVCYGNPTRPVGAFHDAATSDHWRTLTIPASAHPNIISGREEIPGGLSRAWLASMAEEYGVASSIYRARVLALFPEESIEGLVTRAQLKAAVERWHAVQTPPDDEVTFLRWRSDREARHWAPTIMALDVARFGPDASALAVVHGSVVSELVTWRGASLTETADKVMEHGSRLAASDVHRRPPAVWVDEPGLGGGVIDVLTERGYPVHAFNGAEHSSDPSRWLNKRAEAFWHFRTALERGTVALPADADLTEEALSIEWSVNPARGAIQILGKDLLRKALGRSPDRPDAVVIGLAASMGGIRQPMVAFSFMEM
ncbi:MAG TPA: hypothetical protein VJL28_00495 [Gemmatimonadaceae bacterium]|nr:hypothetical protein [Gemmatimonadaceae bacterium]